MGRRGRSGASISQAGFVTLLFVFVMVMILANCAFASMEALARCVSERRALKEQLVAQAVRGFIIQNRCFFAKKRMSENANVFSSKCDVST